MIYLLALIAAVLVWGFVLRDPVISAWRLHRQRQRVVSGVVTATPPVAAFGLAPTTAIQLLLCNSKGFVEHEIGLMSAEPPPTYAYAGKVYRKVERHLGKKHQHDHDVIWEYRR